VRSRILIEQGLRNYFRSPNLFIHSRSHFERSGVIIYAFELQFGETSDASAPDPALIFMSAQLVFKGRHPHIADSFRFTRVTTMDNR